MISIIKASGFKLGLEIRLRFAIHLHEKDLVLLERIKNFFGVGKIFHSTARDDINYQVNSQKDLTIIINHFDRYPLITQKQADYKLFKQALDLVKCKKHLTKEGLQEIVAIKSSMNRGLSGELKVAFPNINSCRKTFSVDKIVLDPN